jgi:serine/threonine protein kinase
MKECPIDSVPLKVIEQDPLVGTRLSNRYEIVSVIGRGGMGVVYKARQEIMDRLMAIKMLHSHMVAEPEAVKRFFREAKTVSQVKHHHVVTLYDFNMSEHGQPYIVMDFLEGKSLKRTVKERGPLTFERADHIFKQVVDGLAAAHALDVVHRDMKPENIMLTKQNDDEDWVTLVDFGLSKLKDEQGEQAFTITRIGDVCGSPPYMSPEQCLSSRVVDPRSDIYALAVVIYEALSNALPFSVKSAIEMLDCHLYGVPIPFNQSVPELKVCTELTHVLNKALQKDPDQRHQTVEEFGVELHEALMRDSLKMRTLRHRAEVASLHGRTQPAVGQKTGTGVALPVPLSPEIEDGIAFLARQAQIEYGMRTTGNNLEAMAGRPDERLSANAVAEPKSDSKKRSKAGKQKEPDGGKDRSDLNDYLLENCPYCDTPIHQNVKFCLNCRRHLLSPQEFSKLRTVQGKHALPKSRRNLEGQLHISSRTKLANDRAMQLIKVQEALKIVLAVLIIYATYSSLQNPAIVEAIQKVAVSFELDMKAKQ